MRLGFGDPRLRGFLILLLEFFGDWILYPSFSNCLISCPASTSSRGLRSSLVPTSCDWSTTVPDVLRLSSGLMESSRLDIYLLSDPCSKPSCCASPSAAWEQAAVGFTSSVDVASEAESIFCLAALASGRETTASLLPESALEISLPFGSIELD